MSRSITLRRTALAVLLAAAAGPAFAGEVYGKVTMGRASVGAAATVGAQCGEKTYKAEPTDKAGAYHFIVADSGRCSLIVTYKDASATLDMVSNEDAVQYDIELEMKDGKLTARRR